MFFLLNISAAFDTTDHKILITPYPSSWLGIRSSVHNWFKSYLSSRYFRAKCKNELSFLQSSCYGVPKVLFSVFYSTSLISSLFLNHYLWANYTRLFFPFHSLNNSDLRFTSTGCSSVDLYMDDSESFNCQLLQYWILARRIWKTTC